MSEQISIKGATIDGDLTVGNRVQVRLPDGFGMDCVVESVGDEGQVELRAIPREIDRDPNTCRVCGSGQYLWAGSEGIICNDCATAELRKERLGE